MLNFSFPVVLSILLGLSSVQCFSHHQGPFHISTSKNAEENHLDFTIEARNSTLLLARIGLGVPSAVGLPSECPRPDPDSVCMEWGDFAQVHFNWVSHPDCIKIQTTSTFARELEDCFDLDIQPPVHWYGGGETHTQTWPIENNARELSPFVTGDFLQSPQYFYGGVVENYFVLSSGIALKIDDKTPLYLSVNTTRPNKLCLVARDHSPYTKRDKLQLTYDICTLNNPKEAHQHATKTFWGQPDSLPDERMLIQPFWSTWAEYKEQVNEQVVLEFARKVMSEGFINSSHIEIDDHWETCYGEEEFDPVKFPNPRRMIDEIKSMNEMRVTAWVHPFINEDCPKFQEGLDNSYFVQSTKPRTGLTWWWQGRRNAGLIDVTNPDAAKWWRERLQKLQTDTGLTSFKFDAGEVNWLPASPNLNNNTDSDLWPQLYTTAYVETVASFGGLIETRVAKLNQKSPTFVRMLDKDSRWGYDNGLRSMIPTLLHMSIVGYPFVLPDMIGGNAYGGEVPSQELYVRWMQVNIFMPAVQFSLAPWRIGESEEERRETVRLCLKVLEEREKYAGLIIQAARQATVDGSPINRPMWWADPENRETYTIDDQYMLGDSIVVAPVVIEGQRNRDIYLPPGTWISGVDGGTQIGPKWLTNYPAPLDTVPFFVKVELNR